MNEYERHILHMEMASTAQRGADVLARMGVPGNAARNRLQSYLGLLDFYTNLVLTRAAGLDMVETPTEEQGEASG